MELWLVCFLVLLSADSKTMVAWHHYIPSPNEVVEGILVSLHPYLCPSVRPSVCATCISTLYTLQFLMDSFHIRQKWSLAWHGVACIMTLILTYNLKVIQLWICHKTIKTSHILSCSLYTTYDLDEFFPYLVQMITSIRGCVACNNFWPWCISSRLFSCDVWVCKFIFNLPYFTQNAA